MVANMNKEKATLILSVVLVPCTIIVNHFLVRHLIDPESTLQIIVFIGWCAITGLAAGMFLGNSIVELTKAKERVSHLKGDD